MSMLGELSFFLGLQICQSSKGIFISKTKYIKEMLKKFGMEYFALVSTSMIKRCKLSKDDESPEENKTLYRSRKPTICDNIKARHHARSRIGCNILICTKGDTCARGKNNIYIFERHNGLWIVVFKK
jgi:hypothetical protein